MVKGDPGKYKYKIVVSLLVNILSRFLAVNRFLLF